MLRRRRLWFALFAFSSLMAVIILMGFTYVFHEMNSLAFRRHEKTSGRNWKRRPTTFIPIDLHIFSDQEANSNSEKFNLLREGYNSRCLCEKRDCQFTNDWMPKVPDTLLYAIQSNKTRINADATEAQKPAFDLLDNDEFWKNESIIAKCPYLILDLGSNRGDTLESFLNVLLSSIYSPSSLSPLVGPGCTNITEHQSQTTAQSYRFDLQSLSVKQRTADELSKRYERVHKRHKLDMESYLDLHIGRVHGEEGDPWMEFQLKERMEQQKNEGEGESAMRKIYEEQMRNTRKQVQNQNRPRPEQYCFYGVEGNPAFTRKLRGLEAIIMGISKGGSENIEHGTLRGATNISPRLSGLRPLRHIHFFTETVAALQNGPTELYLDSVSTDHVGSSLLESHKYAVMGGKEKVTVRGVTLTWLLQHVLDGFGTDTDKNSDVKHGKDNENQNSVVIENEHRRLAANDKFAPPSLYQPGARTSKGNGHLILKIDIEGGEYSVLKESLNSGLLCDYAKKGNRVDLVVEFHKWVIEDKKQKEDFAKLERIFHKELSSCGIHLTKMDTNWH
mmetsp:Transcript_5954/g.13534  ORF Transcript_5954/g.13534 Transcript_5954/m.13534 type:complete len:560 (+) Transcript_5954:356-2035(+)|eukprot:CAMPEP_0172324878 /NCGR_PEP_ID=MMETSP1058-20130122/52534_1 /TAXON_ID=83371 /ORGANISM="Detonula confervacea, Strain CCMP 353" /LENGTH=559 /DNA_ID=CAMNT_0013041287 /DNA_START=275 /DNA_END=1954 /DNA_ORIENTATION=+